MDLSLWISIIALSASLITAWLYLRISASQIDDNIINATNSVLALLERAKTLDPDERRLLVDWLNDWDYFNPPRFLWFFKKRHPTPTDATIEKLKQYFNGLAAADQSSRHNQRVCFALLLNFILWRQFSFRALSNLHCPLFWNIFSNLEYTISH
jgi:hypothetical protein